MDLKETIRRRKATAAAKTQNLPEVADVEAMKQAEAIAADWRAGVATLDPSSPPDHAPARWWADTCEAATSFCDEWGLEAAAKGWDAHSLFGASKARPYARTDLCGLCGFMARKRVVGITDKAVELAVVWHEDARQVYRREDLASKPGGALLWELRP